jgi:hypothetical protein
LKKERKKKDIRYIVAGEEYCTRSVRSIGDIYDFRGNYSFTRVLLSIRHKFGGKSQIAKMR